MLILLETSHELGIAAITTGCESGRQISVQNGMIERNAGLPPERRIEFRVGIHLGDVVEESYGDLMGDSVNIAARLEGIADPGGICLSEDAYRQVRDRLKEGFADLGEKELKNIARPVRVFAIKDCLVRCDAGANSFHTGTRRRPRAGVFRRPAGAPVRG
jgi:class 3 adenylate cyclase